MFKSRTEPMIKIILTTLSIISIMIFTIISSRWVWLLPPLTAVHCLGCTTSLPGQTLLTATVLYPPKPAENLTLRISFQCCIYQVGQHYRLQTILLLCSQIDSDWNIVIQWILPKCLHQPTHCQAELIYLQAELKKSHEDLKEKNIFLSLVLLSPYMCTDVFFNTACHRERTSTCNNCKWKD